MREGSEIVLFLYGIALSGGGGASPCLSAAGLVYYWGCCQRHDVSGLVRIPARHLFTVNGWLIALLAAGMASQAVVFLQQAGWINAFSETLWDTSAILTDGSLAGKALHTLVGYTDRPTDIQLIVYIATLTVIFTLMKLFGHAPLAQLTFQLQLYNR